MTSKEALEKLQEIDNFYEYIFEEMGCYKAIEQDLERLEVLEQENKELKETIEIRKQMNINLIDFGTKLKQENEKLKQQVEDLENNQKTVLTTLEIAVQENEKLKKAIEILKRFNFSVNTTRHNTSGYEVWTDSLLEAQELTQQEYELLKEVLGE